MRASFFLPSSQVTASSNPAAAPLSFDRREKNRKEVPHTCLLNLRVPRVSSAELDAGLKKEALLSADGSSLEALLKGDSTEKRSGGGADLRGSEEDSNQSDCTGGLNPATRIRKVQQPRQQTRLWFDLSSFELRIRIRIRSLYCHC